MNAMIFAAGMGTRLKPLTDTMPKALVPIGGKPLLELVILKLKAAGFDRIIVNVHHFPDQIIDFLQSKEYFGIDIAISDERNQLLETGGGIRHAAHFFNDNQPFLVHNVDILSNVNLQKLYQNHVQSNSLATLVVSSRNTFRYLLFDEQQHLRAWINEKTGETKPQKAMETSKLRKLAFAGIQVLSTKVLQLMENYPDRFSIMDFYLSQIPEQEITGYVPDNFAMMDVGKLDVIDAAEDFVRKLKSR